MSETEKSDFPITTKKVTRAVPIVRAIALVLN